MELYSSVIEKVNNLLLENEKISFDYKEDKAWKETEKFELVMKRDAAFELGEKGSATFMCVTSDDKEVDKDEIIVVGKDLKSINKDEPYARIVLVRVKEDALDTDKDSEKVFRFIQKLDFVKYHVFPEGYMIRTSSENSKEQIRVSREAVKKNISFENIGDLFIRHYKEIPEVEAVKVIFFNKEDIDYDQLAKDSKKVHDITMTLSKILEGMPTDCNMCKLKPICDEVEGMRELHFGKGKEEMGA